MQDTPGQTRHPLATEASRPGEPSDAAARRFLTHEGDFRLGFLPTEQPHPLTNGLAEAAQQDASAAVRMILAVDASLIAAAERAFAELAFETFQNGLHRAFAGGRTVYLSGCGASGRVSLLLEAAWRRFWRRAFSEAPLLKAAFPDAPDQVCGLITGGDYALVRSVESFEDYDAFGRRQMSEAGVREGDVVAAISEGGETSSVIGSAWQGVDAGAQVFFICNNPAEILIRNVARSRKLLLDSRVTHLNLSSGPMAVAGSTRMQAATMEILVVGAAMEAALQQWIAPRLDAAAQKRLGLHCDRRGYLRRFSGLLEILRSPEAVAEIAQMAEREERAYREGGAVTYFADEYLLDIFTDTTERGPTFMLPPFRRSDDTLSPRSWAFAKHLFLPTAQAWTEVCQRAPRCLAWTADIYETLGASEQIRRKPPRISRSDLFQFAIGNEDDPSRRARGADVAVLMLAGPETTCRSAERERILKAFEAATRRFQARFAVMIGPERFEVPGSERLYHVPTRTSRSPLDIWNHLAVKLVLNTLSTVTMARMGRLVSNWMAHVETTNKKLIDRGTRLVSCLTGLGYDEACRALHRAMFELADWPPERGERPSPVAMAVERLIASGARCRSSDQVSRVTTTRNDLRTE